MNRGGSRRAAAAVAALMATTLVVGCSGDRGTLVGDGTATPTSQANGPQETDEATSLEPAATPAAFKAIALKGRGDKVAKFKIPEDAVAIATFTHSGSSNFAVTSLKPTGGQNDLLVNEIGKYKGTVLFDEETHSAAFKIEADGAWTATIKPISGARTWNLGKALAGSGDDVIRVTGAITELASSTFKHSGSSNFAVVLYSDNGRDLAINEIGKYTGEVLMPSGLVVISISADGKWSITAPA